MRDEKSEFMDKTMIDDTAKSDTNNDVASGAESTSSANLQDFPEFADGITATVVNEEPKAEEPKKKSKKAVTPTEVADNKEVFLSDTAPNDADIEFKRDLDDINPNDMEDASWGDSFNSAVNSKSAKNLSTISNSDIDFFYQTATNDLGEETKEDGSEIVVLDEVGNPITKVGTFPSTDLYGPKAKFRKKYRIRRKKPNIIQKVIVRGIPTILLIVVLSFVFKLIAPMLFGSATVGVDSSVVEIKMHNEYYAGTEGTINLKKMFPGTSTFTLTSEAGSATVSDTGKVTNITKDFSVIVNGGEFVNEEMKFKMIAGGRNVDTYKNLHKYAHTPQAKIEAGLYNTPVIITTTELKMLKNAKYSTIILSNDLYGNGVNINANKLVYGNLSQGQGPGAFVIPYLPNNRTVTFRDTLVMGKQAEESDHIKTFTAFGALLDIGGGSDSESKARANVINSVFEKGHKVVHLENAIVKMEGCIVRQASDTAISIATSANKATTLNIKNSVVADSLTGGILMYGYDGGINASCDNEKTWNKLYLEGFVDIYNWKKASDLAFLPDTEGAQLAAIVNPFIASTIAPIESYKEMKVTLEDGKTQYIHFGIIKIFTAGFGKNKSDVFGYEAQGYLTEEFPIPSIATAIMKDIRVWGYFGNNDGAVSATKTLSQGIEEGLYDELKYGRTAA